MNKNIILKAIFWGFIMISYVLSLAFHMEIWKAAVIIFFSAIGGMFIGMKDDEE